MLAALLNLANKDQLLKENKDLIVIMITAARLIFARNWRNDNQLSLEEWYRELWEMAINDKLTCDMKIRRGLSKYNNFKKTWNVFLEHVFQGRKGYTLREQTMKFGRENGLHEI